MLQELAEPPSPVVEPLRRQILGGVQGFEDREADFSFVESGLQRHGKGPFRPFGPPA